MFFAFVSALPLAFDVIRDGMILPYLSTLCLTGPDAVLAVPAVAVPVDILYVLSRSNAAVVPFLPVEAYFPVTPLLLLPVSDSPYRICPPLKVEDCMRGDGSKPSSLSAELYFADTFPAC